MAAYIKKGPFTDESSVPPVDAAYLNQAESFLAAIERPSNIGLIGSYPMLGVPDFPDNLAGTIYKSLPNWSTGVDGWGNALNAALAITGGKLVITATANAVFAGVKALAFGSARTVRLWITASFSGTVSLQGNIDGVSSVVIKNTTVVAGVRTPINVYVAGNMTNVVVASSAGQGVGATIAIDTIYVGTGEYSSLLLDTSGNGNHGTMYNVMPIAGVSGQVLSFNKINSKVVLPSNLVPSTAWTLRVPLNAGNVTDVQWLYDVVLTTLGNCGFYTSGGFLYARGRTSAGASKDISTAIAINTEYVAHLVLSAGTLSLYLNGVYKAQITGVDMVPTTASAIYIGSDNFSSWFGGTIGITKSINRAMSASEVFADFLNPLGPDCTTKAVTAVPNSIPIRGSDGKIQDLTDAVSGLFKAPTADTATDWNTLTALGEFQTVYKGDNAHGPGSGNYFIVRNEGYSTQSFVQFAHSYGGPGLAYLRVCLSGTFQVSALTDANGWMKIATKDGAGNIAANGIAFPATQVVSSDPNTLTDYEKGTFTPALSFGGASVGITYGTQIGVYRKIGDVVFFTLQLGLTSKGSSVGAAVIGGLPFVVAASTNSTASIRTTLVGFSDMLQALISSGGSAISLYESTNFGVVTSINEGDFSNTSNVIVSGSYTV